MLSFLPCLADRQESKLGFFLQSEESAEATHGEVELRGVRCSSSKLRIEKTYVLNLDTIFNIFI